MNFILDTNMEKNTKYFFVKIQNDDIISCDLLNGDVIALFLYLQYQILATRLSSNFYSLVKKFVDQITIYDDIPIKRSITFSCLR